MKASTSLEEHFAPFRKQIIGHQQVFVTPGGPKRILYADWAASGRAYHPIEEWLIKEILPFYGNTHTGTTITASRTTASYAAARSVIKTHVNANATDALIFCGSGMTSAVNKLQRILGLRLPERAQEYTGKIQIDEENRPLVLISHMEHHSNHTSWLETIATVEIIRSGDDGNVDFSHLQELLNRYRHRKHKIAAITACSNVTGIETPYHAVAEIMHAHGGHCFVDFTCSAPYVKMDMHPGDGTDDLDAIYFSMHKFLGGPGTPGVLIFNRQLYDNAVPDQPGGGTVFYTNPWKNREYLEDIEEREDGGTPAILQAIKAGQCIRLKEEMGIENILKREEALVNRLMDGLSEIPGTNILAATNRKRLGLVSFVAVGIHHDKVVEMLNDQFGIQSRGGCNCAGTYGHFLLAIDRKRSLAVLDSLRAGDWRSKPGWVRISIHPTTTDAELDFIVTAVKKMSRLIRGCRKSRQFLV